MSPYFDTIENLIQAIPSLSEMLKNADHYLAHRDKNGEKKPELFEEHFDRVNKYFGLISPENGLDPIIDNLLSECVLSFFPKSDFLKVGNYLKQLFVRTAVYHDFGKVNENFQAKKDKMDNPLFGENRSNPLKHHHSKLGAYLFVLRHFDEVLRLGIVDRAEVQKMMLMVLMFSYPIFRHHSPTLLRPDGQGIRFEAEELVYMKRYLDNYSMNIHPNLAEKGMSPKHLAEKFFKFVYESHKIVFSFPFMALFRLNFSLLTAADYIATGEYSYDLILDGKKDWGIIDDDLKKAIIEAARTSKGYNENAHRFAKDESYQFKDPKEPDGDNLNILRTEMAVKALRTVQKNSDQRLFYLEAPTGGGKTNISLLAVAELLDKNPELNKVFYVFPFTTLITQTHKSIKETLCLSDEYIALMHSKAGFQTLAEEKKQKDREEKEDGLYGEQRKDFLQNLFALYPVSLMTHIRFFNIIKSNRKESIYLMHRLANSIVVLDEIQSYDPKHWDKMMYMLDQYGQYFNIRFILMSATLPRLDKIDAVKRVSPDMPVPLDLLPNPRAYFQNKNFSGRVRFNFELMAKEEIKEAELAAFVLSKSQQRAARQDSHGRVFTIIEFIFKKTATSFKTEIEQLGKYFDKIYVLSGTVLESRRREIINFLKRNQETKGLKVLLITTQVVEAGVDIDMDLGFKNISLIDSDEQLAGRVNRNVNKKDCEVYLFQLNEPNVIYGKDLRFQVTKELEPTFHEEILESKDFTRFYNHVFPEIEKKNQSPIRENFSDYMTFISRLDFPKVHDKFKLIDQKTFSVFVPLSLPLFVDGLDGKPEAFFSKFEIKFLKRYGVLSETDDKVEGEEIWGLFLSLMRSPQDDFIAKKVERKVIQGVLSKFTFSMFDSEKIRLQMRPSCDEERSFKDYLYMHRWREDNVFSLESGLNEKRLNASFI